MVPKKVFFTKGVGRHREKLAAFEMALRNAGIEHCNLVNVSSIFPPHCQIISRKEGKRLLVPGQITFVVLSRNDTNEPNRLLAASIGFALPADPSLHGYLSEHHSFGEKERKAGDYAEDLAAEMLATTLGLEFDPDKSYDEIREVWKISDKIVNSTNITQSAIAGKDGKWTSVVATAVFICDEYKSVDQLEEQKEKEEFEVAADEKDQSKLYKEAEERELPEIDVNNNGNSVDKKEASNG